MPPKPQTYLQLAPEFGSTKFGPFSGVEVRLGSDPSANDITLPEAYGVAPQHVKVLAQPDGSFIIAPTERSATVYAFRGHGRPKQVTSPTAIASGDSFSLVTPEGPRFYVLFERPQDQKGDDLIQSPKDAISAARDGLSAGSLMEEIKRIGFAKVVTSSLGSMAQSAYTFISSGAFLKPRNIILGASVMSGWVMAGGASCAAVGFQQSAAGTESDLVQCEADKAMLGGGSGDLEDQTVPGLTGRVLRDPPRWETTLLGDDAFRQAYVTEYKKYIGSGDKRRRLKWVRNPSKSRDFQAFQSAVKSSGVPDNVARIFAFIAAPEGYVEGREWTLVDSANGDRSCGRGPALMTWRQGKNLGIAPLQIDALVDESVAIGTDIALKRSALEATGGPGLEFADDEVETASIGLQGVKQCMFVAGSDGRSEPRTVAGLMASKFGANSARVPDEGDDYWQLARIMSYYASDAAFGWDRLKFTSGTAPSVVLDDLNAAEKDYVIEQSARLVARTVAVYCDAALDRQMEAPDYLSDLPSDLECLLLDYMIGNE
ncbi:MAG: hypothetical protein KC912_22090 [Proteobacteria bacterium]|nr:hypothetical protein [Pseudomonadota bacterium]